MKKIILQLIVTALLLTPSVIRSQSNITLDAGAMMEIQSGADVCADTRTIVGILTGSGTWCLLPLTPAPPNPVSPANLSVGQNLSLTLVWQRSTGAVTYRVQVSTDSLFSSLIVNDSTVIDSTKAVSGLTPLTYYWWRINAKGIGGTSAYSAVYKFRTLGYPNPVSLVNPPNNATNQPTSIQFRWNRASEQMSPFEYSDNSDVFNEKKSPPPSSATDGFDAVSNYWFDMVTDTVSMVNLTRDTLLTDTTKSVSGLANNTAYYWRVRAKNQIGWGSYSAWYKFTTILAAPPPPNLVSPANNAVGQNLVLMLTWNASASASTYRVQVATDSLFTSLIVNDSTLTDTTRAVSGLTPLTYYWWRVNAKNVGGTSSYSAVYKFRTLGFPNPVSLVNPPNNATNQPISIQFRWSRASEQTNLMEDWKIKERKIEQKQTDGFDAISNYWFDMVTDTVSMANLTRDTTLTDTTKSVSSLSNNTSYFWRVRAKNQIGWGSYSAWWKFTTILAAPPPPSLSSPSNNAVGQNLALTLVWFKSTTAATYRVQVATDSLFTSLIVNDSTLTDSTRAISGLNPLTYYWWRVNAKNVGGTSAFSTAWKFKTIGGPAQVTLINPPNNATNQPLSIQFRWNRASEQTSPFAGMDNPGVNLETSMTALSTPEDLDAISNYWFDMVTDTVSMANLTRDTILTDTTKTVSGLSNNTSYYWRVRAKNQIGWGSYSAWWKFTTIVPVPAPPVLSSPPNNATGQPLTLNLVWFRALYAATYRVQLATDSLFTNILVNDSTVTDSIRAVSGLSNLTSYWWRVNAKNVSGTSSYSSAWKFTTMPLGPAQVSLTVIPGGFYNTSTGRLNMRDTIMVYLVDSLTCTRKDSTKGVLDSVTYSANISFSIANTGNYYIFVYQRNHLTIASRFSQNIIRGSSVSYNFTTDSAKTYGFNVTKVSTTPARWGMIPADANQDGFVDGLDQTIWILQNGLDGYYSADFNGDFFVDGLDQTLWILFNGSSTFLPCGFLNPESIQKQREKKVIPDNPLLNRKEERKR